MALDPNADTFGAILRAKSSAAQTLLNAQLRVDENQLRQRTLDKLPELLRLIAEEEKFLPMPTIEASLH
jgi:hypothetical protein